MGFLLAWRVLLWGCTISAAFAFGHASDAVAFESLYDFDRAKEDARRDYAAIAPLPPLNIDPDSITVSGFDSGAMFANQMQISHSSRVKGAGLVSGVPFMCSQGTLIGATACMQTPLAIVNSILVSQALLFESLGYIDDTANLGRQFTLVFSAPRNSVVSHLSTERMVQMLAVLGVGRVETLYNYTEAGHAWVTDTAGNNPCSYTGSPYINNCNLPFGTVFLKKALSHLGITTSPLLPAMQANGAHGALPDHLLFSQAIFGASPDGNSMDVAGIAFIPPQCLKGRRNGTKCHLHLHFHGCQQGRHTMGNTYAERSGLSTQWAVDNNVVVIYPQAAPNALKYNPMGCWDWFNYNNENFYTNWGEFATKRGVQMRIVSHMIGAILSGT